VQSIQSRYSSARTIHEGDRKERHTMGKVTGDKSRYNRQRRKKIARREQMRALRATLGAKGVATPQAKAGAATSQSKGSAATKI
jgi:hypothetical protein